MLRSRYRIAFLRSSVRITEEGAVAPPTLTIVIPAYNEEARLGPALVGALAHGRARGGPFTILVVDDGSRDGTSAVVQGLQPGAPELPPIPIGATLASLGLLVLFGAAVADLTTSAHLVRMVCRLCSAVG